MTPKKGPKKVSKPIKPAKATPVLKQKMKLAPEPEFEVTEVAKNDTPWYVALLLAGLLLLVGTTLLALPGDMVGFEQRAFAFINGAQLPGWAASQVAKPFSNAVWGMVGLVGVLLLVPKFRLRAWRYGVAAGSAYTLAFIIEHLVDRGRPADLPHDVILRASQDGPGFPSGHVAVLTALALTLWPLISWPWRVLLILLVAAEAWSRVYLGVHAPLDVVAALGVGAVVVAVIHLVPAKLRHFFRLG